MKTTIALLAICMLVIAASHATEAAISCSTIENDLRPCIPYLQNSQGSQAAPPGSCCTGVQSVKSLADATGERKAVCECMKGIATRVSGLNYDLAAKLPTQCGVNMSYTLNPNTDCSKV